MKVLSGLKKSKAFSEESAFRSTRQYHSGLLRIQMACSLSAEMSRSSRVFIRKHFMFPSYIKHSFLTFQFDPGRSLLPQDCSLLLWNKWITVTQSVTQSPSPDEDLGPVVQRPDNFIRWIRHYSGLKIYLTLNVVKGFRSFSNLAVVRVCIFTCTRGNTEIFAQIDTIG